MILVLTQGSSSSVGHTAYIQQNDLFVNSAELATLTFYPSYDYNHDKIMKKKIKQLHPTSMACSSSTYISLRPIKLCE